MLSRIQMRTQAQILHKKSNILKYWHTTSSHTLTRPLKRGCGEKPVPLWVTKDWCPAFLVLPVIRTDVTIASYPPRKSPGLWDVVYVPRPPPSSKRRKVRMCLLYTLSGLLVYSCSWLSESLSPRNIPAAKREVIKANHQSVRLTKLT